jgi:hypothetical protein
VKITVHPTDLFFHAGDEAVRLWSGVDESGQPVHALIAVVVTPDRLAQALRRVRPPTAPESYTCPRCESVSHHPEDVKQRYCARCHRFEDAWAV